MYTRHLEIPVYSSWHDKLDAQHFNIVHRALMRAPGSIRLELPGLKTLDLILQENEWVIVDRAFNDIPVAAWLDFHVKQDRGLHEPIACQLYYFHAHASMILGQVLDLMDELLNEQLKDGDESHQVIDFPQKEE